MVKKTIAKHETTPLRREDYNKHSICSDPGEVTSSLETKCKSKVISSDRCKFALIQSFFSLIKNILNGFYGITQAKKILYIVIRLDISATA